MGFFVCMKREGDEKGKAEQSEAKNHPVNGFLVPRAGGGTAPVPPDESPYLHHQKSSEFLGFLLILGLLCPQNPAKRFHTKFHFEFHSLNEGAFCYSANTAYSAIPLFVCLNPSVAAFPLNFPRIVDTRRGGTYNAKWRKRREIIYIIEVILIMAENRKRRFGDRKDGRLLRSLDPLYRVSSYIMVNRNGASNFFVDNVDIDEIERYIRHKRRDEGLAGFGIMHVLVAAYVRALSQRPAVNRFISGQKIYARNNIEINLTVKLEMKKESSETVIKIRPEHEATATDIYNLFQKEIEFARSESDSSMDNTARILSHIPGLFLKFAVWFLKLLDYFGLLPKKLTDLSPFHGSMFITSMGSLGIPPIFHHLYDFGNVPVFLSFGPKQRKLEIQPDGQIAEKRFISYTAVTDERICDGFYYSTAFKTLKSIMRNPFQLDERPKEVFYDVD